MNPYPADPAGPCRGYPATPLPDYVVSGRVAIGVPGPTPQRQGFRQGSPLWCER